MLHPVLTHKYVYPGLILFWAFHAVLPAALLHYYADLEWTYALVDGGSVQFRSGDCGTVVVVPGVIPYAGDSDNQEAAS
jgi:predicted ribosome-associated RNA-binding protein Tma20